MDGHVECALLHHAEVHRSAHSSRLLSDLPGPMAATVRVPEATCVRPASRMEAAGRPTFLASRMSRSISSSDSTLSAILGCPTSSQLRTSCGYARHACLYTSSTAWQHCAAALPLLYPPQCHWHRPVATTPRDTMLRSVRTRTTSLHDSSGAAKDTSRRLVSPSATPAALRNRPVSQPISSAASAPNAAESRCG